MKINNGVILTGVIVGTGLTGYFVIKKLKERKDKDKIFEAIYRKFNINIYEYRDRIEDLPEELLEMIMEEYRKETCGEELYQEVLDKKGGVCNE